MKKRKTNLEELNDYKRAGNEDAGAFLFYLIRLRLYDLEPEITLIKDTIRKVLGDFYTVHIKGIGYQEFLIELNSRTGELKIFPVSLVYPDDLTQTQKKKI